MALLLPGAGFDEVRVQARGNPLRVGCYKVMAIHLMLLFGSDEGEPASAKRALDVVFLPLLGAAASSANLSLRKDWEDGCLSYTVTARRPIAQAPQRGKP
jgi:hypothetical protein